MKIIGPSFASEIIAAGLAEGVSWAEDTGEIRFNDDVQEAQRDAVAALLAAHDPNAPAPVPIPDSVTRYQARAALAEAGLLEAVNNYFSSLPMGSPGRLAWEEAPTVRRHSDAFVAAAGALGLTTEQVDALLIRAAAFE